MKNNNTTEPGISTARSVEAMLSQMTLEEKIGQMIQVDMNALDSTEDIKTFFIGSMLSGGDSDPSDITAVGWANAYDKYQSYALQTRLKIPLLYGIDAVHGHNNVNGAVIFPHNIGLGATNNPALVEKASRAIAEEIIGTGTDWAAIDQLSPDFKKDIEMSINAGLDMVMIPNGGY